MSCISPVCEKGFCLKHCIYCAIDVSVETNTHDEMCPSSTGVYPVDPIRSPEGIRCMDCGQDIDDFYMHRPLGESQRGEMIVECICVGCGALEIIHGQR